MFIKKIFFLFFISFIILNIAYQYSKYNRNVSFDIIILKEFYLIDIYIYIITCKYYNN